LGIFCSVFKHVFSDLDRSATRIVRTDWKIREEIPDLERDRFRKEKKKARFRALIPCGEFLNSYFSILFQNNS
jgi:hypothetical protein